MQHLVPLLAGLGCLLFALFFVAILVIVFFWGSYRLPAIIGVVLFFAAGRRTPAAARGAVRGAPLPFAATVAEIKKDRRRSAHDEAARHDKRKQTAERRRGTSRNRTCSACRRSCGGTPRAHHRAAVARGTQPCVASIVTTLIGSRCRCSARAG